MRRGPRHRRWAHRGTARPAAPGAAPAPPTSWDPPSNTSRTDGRPASPPPRPARRTAVARSAPHSPRPRSRPRTGAPPPADSHRRRHLRPRMRGKPRCAGRTHAPGARHGAATAPCPGPWRPGRSIRCFACSFLADGRAACADHKKRFIADLRQHTRHPSACGALLSEIPLPLVRISSSRARGAVRCGDDARGGNGVLIA